MLRRFVVLILTLLLVAKTAGAENNVQRLEGYHAPDGKKVDLVGGGIVNLVTALELTRRGYDVTVHDAGPPPHERSARDWRAYSGATMGGQDARMFTLTEADGYGVEHAQSLGRTISEKGWDARLDRTRPEDNAWLRRAMGVSPAQAQRDVDAIFRINHESQPLWDELKREFPALFSASELREGIVRVYAGSDAHFEHAVARQQKAGAFRERLSPADVQRELPVLGNAEPGTLTGGIRVPGFTVNIHKFMNGLVAELEKRHVQFRWRDDIHVATDGVRITGLSGSESGPLRGDHIVISPGAYGGELLRALKTRSGEEIHGMLGAWLVLPDLHGLQHALKGSNSKQPFRANDDFNLTPGTVTGKDGKPIPVMFYGSGYGYTGRDPRNVDRRQLAVLHRTNVANARALFPDALDEALRLGWNSDPAHCVRPWTSSSVPTFEITQHRTPSGGLMVVSAGHNTGGFAQAPRTAKAVAAALAGRHDPVHVSYDPARR